MDKLQGYLSGVIINTSIKGKNMKITGINPSLRYYKTKNKNLKSQNDLNSKTTSNPIYQQKNTDFQNINFTSAKNIIISMLTPPALRCIIGATKYIAQKLDEEEENKRELKRIALKLKRQEEIEKLMDKYAMSEEEAQQYHDKYLSLAAIEPFNNGHEIGLNAIRGYNEEKYELAMKFISPVAVAMANPNEQTKSEVPSGLLLYGPGGSGKTYIAQCLCEHMKKLGVETMDVMLDDKNHRKNAQNIRDAFEQAQYRYKKTGKYTIVKFPEDLDRKFMDSERYPQYSEEMSAFLYRADQCASKGVIWIATANNPKMLDKSVIRRASMKMPIGNMENFEIADMIKYCLMKYGEESSAQEIDYNKILNYLKDNEITCTPFEYEDFVKKAIAGKKQSEQVSADMIIREIEAYDEFSFALDESSKAKFKRDQKYTNSQKEYKKDFKKEDDDDFEKMLDKIDFSQDDASILRAVGSLKVEPGHKDN